MWDRILEVNPERIGCNWPNVYFLFLLKKKRAEWRGAYFEIRAEILAAR